MNIYQPYTYWIGWSHLDRYYYGVRYAQDCHPNDLWQTYFTSSNYVSEFRNEHGEPDIIEIDETFPQLEQAIEYEYDFIKTHNLHTNEQWLNQACWPNVSNNNGRTHSDETKRKMSISKRGKNNGMFGKSHSDETKVKLREAWNHRNRKLSSDTKQKMSIAKKGYTPWNKGKSHSDETKQKMRESWAKRKQTTLL